MRLTTELRNLIGKSIDRGINKSWVAKVIGVTRRTVYKWNKRRKQLNDKKRELKKEKITIKVELFILALRNTFKWGSGRIKQGLFCLPKFMRDKLKELGVNIIQGIKLSRTSINEVLQKHKINGYEKKYKKWHFFRAKSPNELWQLDNKGPVKIQGKKYYFVICIDDYSRDLLLFSQLDHCPNVKEIYNLLKPMITKHKPEKILTDNNPFKEEWDNLLKESEVESVHAHPYYPQDKGKVERAIRNVAEEFIYLIIQFPEWLNGQIKEYQKWYNEKRFHNGIMDFPTRLYT
ncbi:transposase [Candidatus Woesearchaeota archaeon]|nr:transposase [Candidatus Woesearchaeota archaeon]